MVFGGGGGYSFLGECMFISAPREVGECPGTLLGGGGRRPVELFLKAFHWFSIAVPGNVDLSLATVALGLGGGGVKFRHVSHFLNQR